MKMFVKDEETDDYGFFCDLEENIETSKKYDKYNKENHDFIIKISSPKKQYNICYHISLGISVIVTVIIFFKMK